MTATCDDQQQLKKSLVKPGQSTNDTTFEAIAAGHPAALIDDLMPWNFNKQA